MVDSRQHPARADGNLELTGALTRATSHVQMPVTGTVAVAIGGETHRVTRATERSHCHDTGKSG